MTIEHDEPAFECTACGQQQSANDGHGCNFCGGELQERLDQAVSLGVNLNLIEEGFGSLDVHRVLARYAAQCQVQFKLGNNALTPEQVFQPESIMPIICLDALNIWQTIGRRAGAQFEKNDSLRVKFIRTQDSFFDYAAYTAPISSDLSSSFRLLAFTLAARRTLNLKENSTIDLAPKLSLWEQIPWDNEKVPDIPIPRDFDALFYHGEFTNRKFTALAPNPQPVVNQFRASETPFNGPG